METIIPNLKILPDVQRKYWKSLTPIKDMEFILYGGTAIALQIGHRSSIDFNFFTNKDFNYDELKQSLVKHLPFLDSVMVQQSKKNTLTLITDDKVQFSFSGGIDFGRVGVPVMCEDNGLVLASLDDLFALKLATILKRVEFKDYTDIASLLAHGKRLEKGLNDASALYNEMFLPAESLRALNYFDSKELQSLSDEDKNIISSATEKLDFNHLSPNERLSDSLQAPIQEKKLSQDNTKQTQPSP